MWKESYRIGVALIDMQHIELFRMTEDLLRTIERKENSRVFQRAITFLKEYTVQHFVAEEEYQKSISYCGLKEHAKQHRDFTNAVLEFEKRLEKSGYDIRIVKELAGMLTTWLIYHVADTDQKIVKNLEVSEKSEQQSCILSIAASVRDAIEKMSGLSSAAMEQRNLAEMEFHGDILVDVGLSGDIEGHAYFGFSKQFAFKIIELMMSTVPKEVDELVLSAVAEIANIASGNAASALACHGTVCDITPPVVVENRSKSGVFEKVEIDTGAGILKISVELD